MDEKNQQQPDDVMKMQFFFRGRGLLKIRALQEHVKASRRPLVASAEAPELQSGTVNRCRSRSRSEGLCVGYCC
ncbi:uncharacterized protein V6R79_007634 [Siganus canaliculatus]